MHTNAVDAQPGSVDDLVCRGKTPVDFGARQGFFSSEGAAAKDLNCCSASGNISSWISSLWALARVCALSGCGAPSLAEIRARANRGYTQHHRTSHLGWLNKRGSEASLEVILVELKCGRCSSVSSELGVVVGARCVVSGQNLRKEIPGKPVDCAIHARQDGIDVATSRWG